MIEHWFLCHEKQIKRILFIIVVLFLALLETSLLITKHSTGRATILGYQPYFIMSGSMEPTISTYQIVLAVPVKVDDIKVGDIVAYKTETKTVIHRVIGINDDGSFEFKGDANENQIETDKHVLSDQIVSRIVKY